MAQLVYTILAAPLITQESFIRKVLYFSSTAKESSTYGGRQGQPHRKRPNANTEMMQNQKHTNCATEKSCSHRNIAEAKNIHPQETNGKELQQIH